MLDSFEVFDMNRSGYVPLCIRIVALFVVIAGLVFCAMAQDSASGTQTRTTKTRFSDSGTKTRKTIPNQASVQNPAACGPDNVSFRVHLNKNPPSNAHPESGKALVYFIHDGGENSLTYPTTRVALDGNWAGANHGRSYFPVEVNPGEHHACAMVQSSLVGPNLELAHFTADAGKTYYYRTRLILSGQVQLLEFEPLDSDQGKYLTTTLPLSESKPK
jgi:hypothetical protein